MQFQLKSLEIGLHANEVVRSIMSRGFFEGLKTTRKHMKFYRDNFPVVQMEVVYPGEGMVKCKGLIISKKLVL